MIVLGRFRGERPFFVPVRRIGASDPAWQSTNLIGGGDAARPTLGQKKNCSRSSKISDSHHAGSHEFNSTADNCHPTTVCPPGLPAKKRRTTTAARPHEFCSSADYLHPTTACPRRLAAENDPWRFRQQSSRVISIQFWYLTSWLPRFL